MSNEDLLREVGHELRRAHERAATLPAPNYGEIALERENALNTLLNARIPTRYRASRGFVLFGDNKVDEQQIDSIVYDAHNFGTRSNLSGNVVALAKSVAAFSFETINLDMEKFRADVKRIERLKRRFEEDRGSDPFESTLVKQPLAFVIGYRSDDAGVILDAYQAEFKRLDEDGKRWRHLVDGVLLLERGHFLAPVGRLADGTLLRVMLSNVVLQEGAIPDGTEIGLIDGPGTIDAADHMFEVIRAFLMLFKNPTLQGPTSLRLQLNETRTNLAFNRCFRIRVRR